jgi:hypothetical protein
LKKRFLGLSLLSLIFIVVSLFVLHYAFVMLLNRIQMGIPPNVPGGDLSFIGMHDSGIGLSFFGFITLFALFAYVLRNNPTKEVSTHWRGRAWIVWNSDFYYLLAFFLMFIAWAGIWVCLHQAFLVGLEAQVADPPRIPSSLIQFSLFTFTPQSLHSLGFILVIIPLGLLIVLIGVPKFWIYLREN